MMNRREKIDNILAINNQIIDTKYNDPDNFFKIKLNHFKLNRTIQDILSDYNMDQTSGPSTPDI